MSEILQEIKASIDKLNKFQKGERLSLEMFPNQDKDLPYRVQQTSEYGMSTHLFTNLKTKLQVLQELVRNHKKLDEDKT